MALRNVGDEERPLVGQKRIDRAPGGGAALLRRALLALAPEVREHPHEEPHPAVLDELAAGGDRQEGPGGQGPGRDGRNAPCQRPACEGARCS